MDPGQRVSEFQQSMEYMDRLERIILKSMERFPDSLRTIDPGETVHEPSIMRSMKRIDRIINEDPVQTVSEPWIRSRQFPNRGSGPDSFRTVDPVQTVSEPWIRARQFPNHGSGPDRFGMDFAECYYGTFDLNRANLVRLYKETSTMTFEGQKYHGLESIVRMLTEIPFELCKHDISTVDYQPSGSAGDMLVFVSGSLHFRLAGKELHPRFSQIFSLTPTPEGSFVIQNDICRLNYG